MNLQDPTGRFTTRVEAYRKARPGYPDALAELLGEVAGGSPGAELEIADIGVGTGLSTEPLLRAGHRVFGVEPNREMREAAKAAFAESSRFTVVDGSAEATGLPDASVDLVVVAQAFHWFEVEAARREFVRILRPEGWVALVWNDRRLTGTPFLEGYEEILQSYGTDYARVRARTETFTKAREEGEFGTHPLDGFFFGGWVRYTLENSQRLDREELRARVRSASYTPDVGAPGHAEMMAALDDLYRRVAEEGEVEIRYDLVVCLGRVG